MGHKKRPQKELTSSDSESSMSEDRASSGSSDDMDIDRDMESQSESSPDMKGYRRLSKKDLKKLIKLEKKIEKQEALLRKLRVNSKAKSSHKKKDKQPKKQPPISPLKPLQSADQQTESRKLFLAGIPTKYTHEEVTQELSKILRGIIGVTGFRIKRKEGCPTYAFVDFGCLDDARQAKEILKKKKLFGERMPVYYSQDQKKQNTKGYHTPYILRKQCFQCRGYGHFARECQYRTISTTRPIEQAPESKEKQSIDDTLEEKEEIDTGTGALVKFEEGAINEEKVGSRRIVRDKFRLSRLLGQQN